MGDGQTRGESSQLTEPLAVNWDGGVEEPIDWGDDKWQIGDCHPIPEDFDWSRVRNGRILDWDESPNVDDSSGAGGRYPERSGGYGI
jgi:hypothetical protein